MAKLLHTSKKYDFPVLTFSYFLLNWVIKNILFKISFDLLFFMKFFICHNILLLPKQTWKCGNDKSRNTKSIEKRHENYWVFQHTKNTFVFLFIYYSIGSSFDNLVDYICKCAEYWCKSKYISDRSLTEKLGWRFVKIE